MKKLMGALLLSAVAFTSQANSCPDVLKFMKRKLNSQETVNMCSEFQGKSTTSSATECSFENSRQDTPRRRASTSPNTIFQRKQRKSLT